MNYWLAKNEARIKNIGIWTMVFYSLVSEL